MNDDTAIGGSSARFPNTAHSVLHRMGSTDPAERERAFDTLIRAYWKPVYKYLRLHWHETNESAKDLTQDFFATAFEKGYLERYDPALALFRTFVRTCVDGFVSNQHKSEKRLKRGGNQTRLSLDFAGVEMELSLTSPDKLNSPDRLFEQEFARNVFSMALERMRERNSTNDTLAFRLFEQYDLQDDPSSAPSYDELAAQHRIPVSTVTNRLASARRRFRSTVLDVLRELTASDAEFRSEARSLLGIDVP